MSPHFRWFAVAAGCTAALFIAAFYIPNSDVGATVAILSIFLGLPITILLYRDGLRAAQADQDSHTAASFVLTVPIRVLGAVCVVGGIAVLAWVAYSLFIQRQPQFTSVKSIGQVVMPFLLIVFGYRWMRRPLAGPDNHGAADQHAPEDDGTPPRR